MVIALTILFSEHVKFILPADLSDDFKLEINLNLKRGIFTGNNLNLCP